MHCKECLTDFSLAEFLEQRQAAEFDPGDVRSLDERYSSKLIQPGAY